MGNYKSRPKSTCSQELMKKILENYAILEEKLQEDLQLDNFEDLTELQKICCFGTAEQLANLLTSETVGERLDNGMTLLHLCCLSGIKQKLEEQNDVQEDKDAEEGKEVEEAPCYLQLVKSSNEKQNGRKVAKHEMKDDQENCKQDLKLCKSRDIKDQVRLLLRKGADPSIISKQGFSPLHLASYKVTMLWGMKIAKDLILIMN